MAASLGGLLVNRTGNSAVESAVSMKVAESCQRHPTYLEAGFFRGARDTGYSGDIADCSFVIRELKIICATGGESPPLVHPC